MTPNQPFTVGVSFRHELHDLAEAVFKTRAIQAFENAAARYAIHRVYRCAVRRRVAPIFDDLALHSGLVAQRLDLGSLLLEGAGVFVQAEGRRKADYSSCTFYVWAETKERAEEVGASLMRTTGERLEPQHMFVVDWNYCSHYGSLSSTSFEEVAQDVLHDEAYPSLGEPVSVFIQRYLCASETVLVLQGSPGTGKTRLVRSILAALSRRRGESAQVMYTADTRVLENDEIFVDFITGFHDAFVIEDADHMLKARSDGNRDLHRFLGIADGLVRAQGRKIIFSTNLPNIGDIDEALLRPGRCFAVVATRRLTQEEAGRLIARLCESDPEACRGARERVVATESRTVSVASVRSASTRSRRSRTTSACWL
jgi:hypothetical protein